MTRILFLAANPKDTPRTRLDEEIRTIEKRIRLADLRDLFDVKQEWALRATDFQRTLMQYKPEIVHFAGLGTASGEILLEDKAGESHPVSAAVIGQVFSILKDNVRCVVITACFAETQAQAISEHVDCVVGMSRMVGDAAAICFAAAFYQALGFGRTIRTAFDLGRNQLEIEGLSGDVSPLLLTSHSNGASYAFGNLERTDLLGSIVLLKLNEGGSSQRAEAARQLGNLKDPAAVPIFERRWLSEPDPTVRYWLAIALSWIGGERASHALVRLKQTETDPFAQSGINEALKNSLDKAVV